MIGLNKIAKKDETDGKVEKGEKLDSKNAPMLQEMGMLGLAKRKAEKKGKGATNEEKEDDSNLLAEETRQSGEEVEKKAGQVGTGVGSALFGPIGAAVGAEKGKRLRSAGGSLAGGLTGSLASKAIESKLPSKYRVPLRLLSTLGGGAAGASLAHGKNTKKKKKPMKKKAEMDMAMSGNLMGLGKAYKGKKGKKDKKMEKEAMGLERAAVKAIKGPAKVNQVMKAVPKSKRDDVLKKLRKSK